jgi:hypothetical protein
MQREDVGNLHYEAANDDWDWVIRDNPILTGIRALFSVESAEGYDIMSEPPP